MSTVQYLLLLTPEHPHEILTSHLCNPSNISTSLARTVKRDVAVLHLATQEPDCDIPVATSWAQLHCTRPKCISGTSTPLCRSSHSSHAATICSRGPCGHFRLQDWPEPFRGISTNNLPNGRSLVIRAPVFRTTVTVHSFLPPSHITPPPLTSTVMVNRIPAVVRRRL
jgi:hypothetical protein